MKTSLRRRTTAATTVLLLGLTLAACGDDSSDEASDDPTTETTSEATSEATSEEPDETATSEPVEPPTAVVPSEAELQSVLLTTADLPAGFAQTPNDDEDDTTFDDTCLAEVGDFEDALGYEPDAEAEAQFTQEDANGQGFVGSKITAYADPAPVAAEFTSFVDVLQECTEVSATDEDGVTFDLQIAYDETVSVPDAEQQVTISMTGTVAAGDQSFDVGYDFVIALSGSFISIVGASEVGQSATGVLGSANDFALLQAQRLADLVG